DNVSLEEAVLFDILGVPFHGIRRSNFRVGDKAVVLGAGAIGLSAVLFLKMGGARHITVVDPISKKRELAVRFGADLALDPKEEGDGLAGKVVELYDGIGAEVAYECAGYPDAISSAANVTKSGGQTVIMGTSPEQIPLASAHLCPREVDLLTSFVYTEDEIKMILGLMENGKLDTEGMVTDTINLEDVEEKGFKRLAAAEDQVKILIKP
ncbi:MAG: zinc-binding dehydrogenase, partial [Desulfobacteraceae bacterium]|nr:zinc-binding dehydrogenase [Desulfobacteraceae bacterium]